MSSTVIREVRREKNKLFRVKSHSEMSHSVTERGSATTIDEAPNFQRNGSQGNLDNTAIPNPPRVKASEAVLSKISLMLTKHTRKQKQESACEMTLVEQRLNNMKKETPATQQLQTLRYLKLTHGYHG